MPVVDDNRIIGNYGSNLIAHILSGFCLVRPVAEGTDVGVDLFCETVEDGEAFLHFWAQVKTGSQVRRKKNGRASCRFKTDHLRYWNRQPVPVFAFYVPCAIPLEKPKEIFVTNLTKYLMTAGVPSAKSKVIESDFKINPETEDWHNLFLSRLTVTVSHLKLRDDGIIASIPELRPAYIKTYPIPIGASNYAEKTLRTIRSTVSGLVFDAARLKHERASDPPKNYFEPIVKILEIFEAGKRPRGKGDVHKYITNCCSGMTYLYTYERPPRHLNTHQ